VKTFNTYYKNCRDLKQFVETNSDILSANNNGAILVQVFSGICDKDFLNDLSKQIIELVPRAQVLGATTSGEIMNGMISEQKTVLAFSVFQHSNIKTSFVVKNQKSDYEVGRSIATALNVDKAKVLILFATSLTINSGQMLKGVQSVNADLPVAGGNAADNFAHHSGFVFCNEAITDCGVVGVALSGECLTVNHHWHLGWQPISKEMTITKADDSRVYTIDNLPAIQIYNKYLGLSEGADIFNVIEFPLLTYRSGVQIARIPHARYADGSISFQADLVEGERVRFSFAQVEIISATVGNLVRKIKQQPAESIFVYSCASRIGFLKELTQVETMPLQEIAPVAGFFTYGEFFHADKNNLLLNATMTTLVLSESACNKDMATPNSVVPVYNSGLKNDNIINKNNVADRNLGVLKTLTHLVNTVTGELQEANEKLQHMMVRFNLVTTAIKLGLWDVHIGDEDPYHHAIVYTWTDKMRRLMGLTDERDQPNLLNEWVSRIHPEDQERTINAYMASVKDHTGRTLYNQEHRLKMKTGEFRWFQTIGTAIRDKEGQAIRFAGALFDIHDKKLEEKKLKEYLIQLQREISERKQAEEALRTSRETLSIAAELASLGPWKYDVLTHLFEFGNEFYAIYGTDVAQEGAFMASDVYAKEFVHPDDTWIVETEIRKGLSSTERYYSARMEHRIIRRDGLVRTIVVRIIIERDAHGQIVKSYGANLDITEHKQTEEAIRKKTEEIQRLAYTDSLTNLPNRAYLTERLEEEMEKARRGKSSGVLLFIDLDNLKMVNDAFGHTYGDALIIMAGNRIVEQAGSGAFVGRIGGDEFMAILPGQSNRSISPIIEGIFAALCQDIEVLGVRFHISASLGAAIYPNDGDTSEEIFKNADNAMYAAKKAGKNCWRFYEATMQAVAYEKMLLTNSLHHAIERGELLLHYQPQVSVNSGSVVGFEALLRWNSQEHGSISPLRFIPLAEQSGLIQSIGEWVLREACRFARRLADQGWGHIHVAVNVSPYQLRSDLFIESVRKALHDFGILPCRLQLEITETALISSLEESTRRLGQLQALGVPLALDDFGTGYSSLTYLQHLPVEILKIDKSFIDMIPVVGTRKAIIGHVVNMAHTMEMTVVAEGVETQEQFDYLALYGCDCIQGYLFSRPIPEEEAVAFLSIRL